MPSQAQLLQALRAERIKANEFTSQINLLGSIAGALLRKLLAESVNKTGETITIDHLVLPWEEINNADTDFAVEVSAFGVKIANQPAEKPEGHDEPVEPTEPGTSEVQPPSSGLILPFGYATEGARRPGADEAPDTQLREDSSQISS